MSISSNPFHKGGDKEYELDMKTTTEMMMMTMVELLTMEGDALDLCDCLALTDEGRYLPMS
jgi:hypothetical protein